jgi:hypothetical protein
MTLIPFWASFWTRLLDELSMLSEKDKSDICPIIPSAHGLFFCKLTNIEDGSQFIEVRTYVHESSLNDSQKQVRNMLLNASQNIENSIICLYPYHLDTPNPDLSRLEFNIVLCLILGRIKSETYELCEILLPEKNVCKVYELDRNIKEVIADYSFSESSCNNCNEVLNAHGYRFWVNDFIRALQQ